MLVFPVSTTGWGTLRLARDSRGSQQSPPSGSPGTRGITRHPSPAELGQAGGAAAGPAGAGGLSGLCDEGVMAWSLHRCSLSGRQHSKPHPCLQARDSGPPDGSGRVMRTLSSPLAPLPMSGPAQFTLEKAQASQGFCRLHRLCAMWAGCLPRPAHLAASAGSLAPESCVHLALAGQAFSGPEQGGLRASPGAVQALSVGKGGCHSPPSHQVVLCQPPMA